MLVCSTAKKVFDKKDANKDFIFREKIINKSQLKTLDDVFSYFWYSQDQSEILSHKELLKSVANNFRIVNYESCKGVWDDRPYPIIWYSDNWEETILGTKYDETYLGNRVTEEFITSKYADKLEKYLCTYDMLSKIYDNVSAFKTIINKILLESDFSMWSKAQMDKQYTAKTYLYYSVVCIHKKSRGVLVFKRHSERGHLANVWDFDQRKPAQLIDGGSDIVQIQNGFYDNFGIKIKVVLDKNRKSLLPIDIHPIYRKNKIHHGILCFAYIEDDRNSEEILLHLKQQLPKVRSSYGYPLYSDVEFVYGKDVTEQDIIFIGNHTISEIAYEDILNDSESWNDHKKGEILMNKCVPNLPLTVRDAIRHISREAYVPDKFFITRYFAEHQQNEENKNE